MDCEFCHHHIAACACPTIDVRLRALRRSGSVVMPWCCRCDRHLDRCICKSPMTNQPGPRQYECLVCERRNDAPLVVRTCSICGQYCCSGCLPDHETRCAKDLAKLEELSAT